MYISSVSQVSSKASILREIGHNAIGLVVCYEMIVGNSIEGCIVVLIALIFGRQLGLDVLHDLGIDSHIIVAVHVSIMVFHRIIRVTSKKLIFHVFDGLADFVERIKKIVMLIDDLMVIQFRGFLLGTWATSSHNISSNDRRLVGIFTLWTTLDNLTDSLLDADPVILR